MSPAGGRRTFRARCSASLNRSLGIVRAHVPADDFARATVKPHVQVAPATVLVGQVRDVAHPDPVWGGGGRLAEQAVGCGAHGRVGIGRARYQ